MMTTIYYIILGFILEINLKENEDFTISFLKKILRKKSTEECDITLFDMVC